MTSWRDIRAHLEATEDPDLAAVLAELTPADRIAAGPSWFAKMVEQARPKWQRDGLCVEYELDFFSGRAADQAEAVEVCRRCLCRDDCLSYAIDNGEHFGIWGGHTPAERRAMRGGLAA